VPAAGWNNMPSHLSGAHLLSSFFRYCMSFYAGPHWTRARVGSPGRPRYDRCSGGQRPTSHELFLEARVPQSTHSSDASLTASPNPETCRFDPRRAAHVEGTWQIVSHSANCLHAFSLTGPSCFVSFSVYGPKDGMQDCATTVANPAHAQVR
jgi:hypothetical protein